MAKEIIVDEVKEVKKPTNKKIAKKEEVVVEKKEEVVVEEAPKGTVEKLLNNKKEEVVVIKEEPKEKPQTTVRILLNQDHKCNIGGNWYCFKKDKHYNVPENVKAILMRAGKLSPL